MSLSWSKYATMYRCRLGGDLVGLTSFCAGIESWVPGARVRDGNDGAVGVRPGETCLDLPVHCVQPAVAWAAHMQVTLTGWVVKKPAPLRTRKPDTEIRQDPEARRPYDWQRQAAQNVLAVLAADYRGAGLKMGCGGGKTITLLETLTHLEGPILITGPAVARSAWVEDIAASLRIKPHVMYPKSERKADDLTLPQYLDLCRGFPAAPGLPSTAARVHLWAGPDTQPWHVEHVRTALQRMGRLILVAEAAPGVPAPAGKLKVDTIILMGALPSSWVAAAASAAVPVHRVEIPVPQRPWVITGFEVFADVAAEMDAANYRPAIFVIDEWHQLSESGMWTASTREPGGVCPKCGAKGAATDGSPEDFVPAEPCKQGCDGRAWSLVVTKGAKKAQAELSGARGTEWDTAVQSTRHAKAPSQRAIRSAAVWDYRRRDHVEVVIATTATLPESADQAKAYMPLTILHPYHWGRKRNFEAHFASGRVAEPPHPRAGYWTTGPNSCIEDLRAQCLPFITIVPPSVSHSDVRPMAIRTVWLSPSVQTRSAKPMQVTADEDLQVFGGRPRSQAEGENRSREGRIMRGLAAARGPALSDAVDILEAGQDLVLFTTRREECAELHRQLMTRAPKGSLVVRADGSVPTQRARDAIKHQWLDYSGPKALVGTGYAWASSANGLHKAHVILQTGIPDSPVSQIQWCGRGSRHGSLCAEYRIYIPEGSIFEEVARKIEERCGDLRLLFDPMHAGELAQTLSDLGSIDNILASILTEPVSGARSFA